MFKTRLISGIVLILIAAVTIFFGGTVMLGVQFILSMIGVDELYRAMDLKKEKNSSLAVAGYAGIVLYYAAVWAGMEKFGMPALILALLLLLCIYVFSYPKYTAEQVMAAFFGIVYVGVLLSYVYLSRELAGGIWLVVMILICSWGCDTCAYCVGMLIGKHKMTPKLSPKKTIEGAVGGVAGSALLGALLAALTGGTIPFYALIGGVGALISMVGDLAASAIKRNRNIKDYGTLIPGHGGVLDRFDSVLVTAPVIYYLAKILL